MKRKKILVTGAGAVLGAGVKAVAGEYPDWECVYLTSKDCDLTNAAKTLELFRAHEPRAVFHIAAISGGIGLSIKHPATMLRDNVLMAFSVLEAARTLGVEKTIMTLTTGMYPVDAPLPYNEDSIHNGYPHPSNYGSSFAKRLVDPAVRAYREEFGLSVVGLIPNGIFGPHDSFHPEHAGLVPSLIRRIQENRETSADIVVWGDGTPLREYTYAPDLARAYFWALDHYDEPQVLNIGSTEEHSVRDIAWMIADIVGVDRKRIVFDTTKPSGVFRKPTDNTRYVTRSGYKYTPFYDGLKATIAWYQDTLARDPASLRLKGKAGT